MTILVTGKLVIVYGKLLINNKMGYCGLGQHLSEKYIYAPITGLGSNNSNISSYGFAYIKPNEDRLNVYLSAANTYAIICISYICK